MSPSLPPDAPRNRLARESSPYLLLHAGNPVDWFPWGEEAIEKARREDKPLFLSVGYSTCYWCHVMERESFSDPDIARLLNEGFVCVKLDREERPDLDEIYMTATQLLTRSGGWPNSLFLTHDLKPFYAGTYFPPDDRYGRPGFPRVLAAVRDAWRSRRESVVEQAESVAEAMREQMERASSRPRLPGTGTVDATRDQLARRFDPEWGGFGPAPKFPSPANLFFLLDRAAVGDIQARDMLVVTLDRMARGGIHDQLAGGFHRYSTDAFWLVPHFEKMLYDNAALASLYASSAALAPGLGFEGVARSTLDFVLRELTGAEGGFLSAIDAETDGHEGAYYSWTRAELQERLDPAAFDLLGRVYGFAGEPNFEGDRYVLRLVEPLADLAREEGVDVEELLRRLAPGRQALLDARGERRRPLVDDKVLTDWNGLMIGAMARGGRVLGDERYIVAARRAADFVQARLTAKDGTLRHSYRGGAAKVTALLDDYAFLVEGLLALHAATGEERWLAEVRRVQDELDLRLWDDAGGGYFMATGDDRLLFQSKPGYDGAVASGNGVAALNLLELARLTGDLGRRERAARLLRAFGESIEQLPLAHVTLVTAAARFGEAAGSAAPPARRVDALAEEARDVVVARGRLEGEEAGGWRPFVVELTVREGWHVNANPASETFLVPLVVSGAALRLVTYPPPSELQASFAGAPILAYRRSVRVTGEIALGATAPVVSVTYQACDDTRCLPPVSVEVPLA